MPNRRRRRFSALGKDQRQPSSTAGQPLIDDPDEPELEAEEPAEHLADDEPTEGIPEEAEATEDAPFAIKPPLARRPKPWRRVSFPFALGLAVLSAGLGALAVCLLTKPMEIPSQPSAQKEPVLLTPGDQEELDAAYAARDARHFEEAEQRFTALAVKHPGWTTLPLEVSRTLLHRQNYLGARAALHDTVAKGQDLAAATLLIGVASDAEKSYPEAEASFARAVALDPTQADAYFLWGECLRGQGKMATAVEKYRSALLRNEDDTGAGLYRLKLWLCEIEAGQMPPDAIAKIDAALTRPYPPMEALFAAAARELKAGDLRSAATHLVRARERTDPQIFLAVLNDPLFVQARSTPELSSMIQSIPVAPSVDNTGPGILPAPLPAGPALKKE